MPTRPRSSTDRPRRGLLIAITLTVLVVLASLAGLGAPERLRAWGGTVLGPVERALAPSRGTDTGTVEQQRDRLAEQLRAAELAATDRVELDRLLASPATDGAELVPAHVVGIGRVGSAGPERATLDVGSRDGVTVDSTVVAAGGLVGRVVAVAPWTCDVALVGAPELVVGVRVGESGLIGTLRAPTGGEPTGLRLELVQAGQVREGDEVRTLGSVDGRPFVAGVVVGEVASVDPLRGRATESATVTPAVTTGSLRLVAVLRTAPRATPRPVVTGGAP